MSSTLLSVDSIWMAHVITNSVDTVMWFRNTQIVPIIVCGLADHFQWEDTAREEANVRFFTSTTALISKRVANVQEGKVAHLPTPSRRDYRNLWLCHKTPVELLLLEIPT